jgi:cell fate regulator YaaT (PSP1 superfamily)
MDNTISVKPKLDKSKKYILVRYGRMAILGLFEHSEANIPRMDTKVVVKTEKGLELGSVVGYLSPYKAGSYKFDSDQLKDYFEKSGMEVSTETAGKFVRFASSEDVEEDKHLQKIARDEMVFCQKTADEMKLQMKIVDVEHIFGGERIIFYFMADTRVDFRELVKKLAHEYQSRIELRQIGARDEAKILGDVETCGQVCCCIRYLKTLKPVNMRMAKMQKATLDPSKISGYCGRLKCCLRYEDDIYTELKRKLPRKKTLVRTPQGQGRVVDGQILAQMVIVEMQDGKIEFVPLDQIEILEAPQGGGADESSEEEAAGEHETEVRKENIRDDTTPKEDDEKPDEKNLGDDEKPQ